MRLIFVSLFITILTACANTTPSEPYLNQAPITQYDSLNDYWLTDNKVHPLTYMTREQRKVLQGQRIDIKVKYLIDSNGDIHDVEIYESNVDIPMQSTVTRALQKLDFYPAKSNKERKPIVAHAAISFECH